MSIVKLLPIVTSLIPPLKKFIFPNGVFDRTRGLIVFAMSVLVPLGIYYLGEDTMNASLIYLKQLVPLLGTVDEAFTSSVLP